MGRMPAAERAEVWQRAFEKTLVEYWERGWLAVE
jgi:hypothetical protein